jgi:hypothetical protein
LEIYSISKKGRQIENLVPAARCKDILTGRHTQPLELIQRPSKVYASEMTLEYAEFFMTGQMSL